VGERLQGLALFLVGSASLLLIYLAQQYGWLATRPPAPPGLENVPVVSPFACLVPLISIGSLGLCMVGLKKLFEPTQRWPRGGPR
jgi:hypothetical protein